MLLVTKKHLTLRKKPKLSTLTAWTCRQPTNRPTEEKRDFHVTPKKKAAETLVNQLLK